MVPVGTSIDDITRDMVLDILASLCSWIMFASGVLTIEPCGSLKEKQVR
jgi:hypothetical protein